MSFIIAILINIASVGIGLLHMTGYMPFENAMVWLTVYAVLMLVEIQQKTQSTNQ